MTIKTNGMNKIVKLFFVTAIIVSVSSCGDSKNENENVAKLKAELEKLKAEKNKLDGEIKKIEEDILKADPNAASVTKLVAVDTVAKKDFEHYIELQGKVDADNIAYVAPLGMGGVVKAVYVKLGDRVSKGQLILKLDDAIARQQVVAAQQNAEVLKARLSQAKTLYERRQNLWKQNIGTEIEVINAKADVDALQSQLNAAESMLKTAQEQADQSNVRAEISGVIDEMNVKPGELFASQMVAQPGMGIRIVNASSLKMVTGVPENYITRVKKGSKALVTVPETGKAPYETAINTVGASVSANTRSFITEAKLPTDPLLKPNQTASVKILDYQAKDVIVVPVNVVQTDEKGKYVFVMEKAGGKLIAKKKPVTVGMVYDGQIEVKSGLSHGELIVTDGYQSIYDGQAITTGI